MVTIDWSVERGWHDARVVPYSPLALDPASSVLHYGQEIFEGLKAYRHAAVTPLTVGSGTGVALAGVATKMAVKSASRSVAKEFSTAVGRTVTKATERTWAVQIKTTDSAIPLIKPGPEGGSTAGKVFSRSTKDDVLRDNPSTCV